jgi:hypothetical protein
MANSNRKEVAHMAGSKRTPSERKTTSKPVASEASRILRDGRYSEAAKSVAGSAMAQAKGKKGK